MKHKPNLRFQTARRTVSVILSLCNSQIDFVCFNFFFPSNILLKDYAQQKLTYKI